MIYPRSLCTELFALNVLLRTLQTIKCHDCASSTVTVVLGSLQLPAISQKELGQKTRGSW